MSRGSGRTWSRRRRVLDELDQPVAIDHLAGSNRHVAANHEILGAERLLSADRALPILHHVAPAAHQIHPAFADGVAKDFRVGQQEVRGGDHVEELARCELHHGFMVLGDAADTGGRVVPPLLIQQEALVHEIVRPFLPLRSVETAILRQRFDAARCRILAAFQRTPGGIVGETHCFSRGLVDELHALARRKGELGGPVKIGLGKRGGRQAKRETRERGVQ